MQTQSELGPLAVTAPPTQLLNLKGLKSVRNNEQEE